MFSTSDLRLVAEFLGTFVFFSVILTTLTKKSPGPMGVALALMVSILFVGNISGGHFNPAVTYLMHLQGVIRTPEALKYVAAQLLGAHAASLFFGMARPFYI